MVAMTRVALALALAAPLGCISTPTPPGPCAIYRVDAVNSDSDERDPWLSLDFNELYFESDRDAALGGTFQIYRATRASPADPFSPPTRLAGLDPPESRDIRAPFLSDDELTLYYLDNFTPSRVTRATRADEFLASASVPLAVATQVQSVGVDSRDVTMVYSINSGHLFVTTRQPGGDFTAGREVDMTNISTGYESHPALNADATVMAFERADPNGNDNVLLSTTTTDGFANAAPPTPLPIGHIPGTPDYSPFLHRDGHTVAFATERGTSNFLGDVDIWIAEGCAAPF
jgi:hypothetical protein